MFVYDNSLVNVIVNYELLLNNYCCNGLCLA